MLLVNEHSTGNSGKKRKSLQGDEKSSVAILLTDDALAAAGFREGEQLEIEIGELSPDDLGAVLLFDGRWFVGYVSVFDDGVKLSDGRGWVFFPGNTIAACGGVIHPGMKAGHFVPRIKATADNQTQTRPVMTWQMTSKGIVTRADPLCRQFLGLTNEDLRAGLWKNRIHPDDRTNYIRSRERALAENTIYENTVRVLDARDEYCLVTIVIVPIWSDDGLVMGWQAIAKLSEGLIKRSA